MEKSLVKGLIAGAIAGIVATKLKSTIEEHLPVRSDETDSPPVVLADRITKISNEKGLKESEKKQAEKKSLGFWYNNSSHLWSCSRKKT